MPTLDELSIPVPAPGPLDWNPDGVLILKGFLGSDTINDYEKEWEAANGYHSLTSVENCDTADGRTLYTLDAERPGGWPYVAPYMENPALMALCCDQLLANELESLVGMPAGLHLNLSGWVSTTRNWHQDGYLNPASVGDHYAAVWMALDDVHPGSGVFQFIPGSHRWHRLTRERIGAHVDLRDPAWPTHSETVLTPLVEAELMRRWNSHEADLPVGADFDDISHTDSGVDAAIEDGTLRPSVELPGVYDFVPNKGDVLIWHPRLYHRGSVGIVEDAYRPALISHFSGLEAHPQLGTPERHALGGYYWPIQTEHPV